MCVKGKVELERYSANYQLADKHIVWYIYCPEIIKLIEKMKKLWGKYISYDDDNIYLTKDTFE